MIDQNLIQIIRNQFALDWDGIHGPPHWARVRENGLRLAEVTGAKRNVIELFAFLHDSRRRGDGADPQHGQRAAACAKTLAGTAFQLEPDELELLTTAYSQHSDGLIKGDITVLSCWDADRLDLGRVGNRARRELLCTAAARDPVVLDWAYKRSIR